MLSKRDLQSLLRDNQVEFSIKTSYSSKGPGYLDPWLLMQKRKKIWQHVEPVRTSSGRKIILCEPFEGVVAPQRFTIAFIAALVEHYEVYLWPGTKKHIHAVRPLAAPAEFWQLRRHAEAASQEEVIDSLAYQGLNTDQFIILDHQAYAELLARWHADFVEHPLFNLVATKKLKEHDPFTLDLTGVSINEATEIARHVVRDDIKKILIYPPTKAELDTLLRLFGKLETLVVKYATAEWVREVLNTNYGVAVELKRFMVRGNYQLPASVDIESLLFVMDKHANIKSFSVERGARVQRLGFIKCGEMKCNLTYLVSLEALIFEKGSDIELVVDRRSQLQSLEMRHAVFKKTSLLPTLRHLKVIGYSYFGKSVSLLKIGKTNRFLEFLASIGLDFRSAAPQLETLELGYPYRLNEGGFHPNLSRDDVLQSVSAVKLDDWQITYPPHDIVMRDIDDSQMIEPQRHPRGEYEAWSSGGRLHHNYDRAQKGDWKYLREARPPAIARESIDRLSSFPALEIVKYQGIMPVAENVKNINPGIKQFKISDLGRFESLNFDFTDQTSLRNIVIDVPGSKNTRIDLTGCHELLHLYVHVGIHPVTIEGLSDCSLLRTVHVRSNNTDILKQMVLVDAPPQCVIYTYKDTPADVGPGPIRRAIRDCLPASSCLPAMNSCCDCGCSLPAGPSCCCSCSRGACITFTSIAGVLVAGMAAYLVYCLVSGFRPFSYGGGGGTEPPVSHNQTLPATPVPESPMPEYMKIVLGAGSAGLLLLVCLGVLAYRYRARLRRLFISPPDPYDMSLYGASVVDGESMLFDRDIRFNERFEYNFYTGHTIDFDHVRLHVQNAASWRRRQLYFYTDLTGLKLVRVPEQLLAEGANDRLSDLMRDVSRNHEEALAYIKGVLKPGEMYPLPTLESIESEHDLLGIFSAQSDLIHFHYLPGTQQLYFSLKDRSRQAAPVEATIFYHFKRNLNYLAIPYDKEAGPVEHIAADADVEVVSVDDLLPQEVIRMAGKWLAGSRELRFMFDRELSVQHKLNCLIDYFREMTYEELDPQPDHPIKLLFEIIIQNKGVCRHAGMGFFTMARLLGVPVTMNNNAGYRRVGHRFCSIPFNTVEGVRYERVDLTLPDNALEYSDDDLGLFRELLVNMRYQSGPAEIIVDDSRESREAYHRYYENFHQAVSVDVLTSIRPILARGNSIFSPLIELADDQAPLVVNDGIVQQMKSLGMDVLTQHLYIDSPEDFLTYLQPDTIVNGVCETIQCGPLMEMLSCSSKPCLLVVNWSHFTAAQIASFQSLIDAEPMLTVGELAIKLSEKVIVLGLIRDAFAAGKAFVSRSKRWQLDDRFLMSTVQPQRHAQQKMIEVDLFHRPAWREPLLGEIDFQGKNTLLSEGAINRAIQLGCPLMVYNPPDDASFTQLVHQVNGERKLLLNGHVRAIPEGVYVLTDAKENALSAENIHLETNDHQPDDRRQRLFISINNLHELFKLLRIDANRMADTFVGGLLRQYDPLTQVIYVIGDVPKSYWQAFVAYINKHHADKSIHVLLSPGARIESVSEGVALEALVCYDFSLKPWLKDNVIVSNDPDYIVEQAARDLSGAVVMHITPETSFSSMLASIVHDDEHQTGFIYTEHGLLTALKAGKTVILSGEMSLTLYYQLQPLLSAYPHIHLNGERQHVSGRLLSVMPANVKDYLPGVTVECNLAFDHYVALMQTDGHRSFVADHVFRVQQYFQLLQQLPHRGPGRPPKPEMTFQRLKLMLHALSDGQHLMHEHNPVKGFVNYHYPRYSEDQAYINVIGKYVFRADDETSSNGNKIRALINKFDIHSIEKLTLHVWKILNCLYGAKLHELFADNLLDMVRGGGFPAVTPDVLAKLFDMCQAAAAEPDDLLVMKRPRVDKRFAQLQAALSDDAIQVILLKGDPGIGKTYTIRKLIGDYYEGEAALLAYLNAEDKGVPIVFLSDEINMLRPGAMDFLIKGLVSPNREVYYRDKLYYLSPRHKLLGTANPEHFPGRHYHQAILDYALVIYFDEPENAFLLGLACNVLSGDLHQYAETILFAYYEIKKFNPFFVTSIRDIENLAHRFNYLAAKQSRHDDVATLRALVNACVTEFAGSIRDEADRYKFIRSIEDHVGVKLPLAANVLIPLTDAVSITSQKQYIARAIEQNLEIRLQALMQHALNASSRSPVAYRLFDDKGKEEADGEKVVPVGFKQADILEGEPGIGKSTVLRAVVDQYKQTLLQRKAELQALPGTREIRIMLNVIHSEIHKPVYEISVGAADSAATLTRALHEEAIIIGDEANIDPMVEQCLTQYLSGVDENQVPVQLLFMFLGSQNSSAHAGRPDASHAIRNRAHFIYMDGFSKQEYEQYASAANIAYSGQFVRAFMDICRVFPAANTRTFHQVLKSVMARQVHDNQHRSPAFEQFRLVVPFRVNGGADRADMEEMVPLLRRE